MSFLKFWGKKTKSKDDLDNRKDDSEAEAEKRKLRPSLSISRSGRFKQKKRDRGGILDRPELYGSEQGDSKEQSGFSSSASTTSNSSATSGASSSTTTPSRRSPKASYPSAQGTRRPSNPMAT